jgi:hypothetical protein
MRFDLKKPCKNCPFRTDGTAIRFSCRERAEEIAESAYRNGFPCHLSADYLDDEQFGEAGGFTFGEDTQHCAGALIMFMKQHEECWPGVDNDEELVERLWKHLDFDSPVFENEEDFIEASSNRGED